MPARWFGLFAVPLRNRSNVEPTSPTDPRPALNRALPGWAIDAIADGLPTKDGRKVYAKCVSIAMSAHLRGWSEAQYVNEIASPTSRLWAQLMTRRDGRTASMPTAMKSLRKAWATGVANANNVGMRTRDEIADEAVELAYQWADRLDDATDGLSATETAVMQYVVAQTAERKMLRVTCPGRAVAEAASIPHRTATRVLAELTRRGFLVKHSAGSRGEPGKGKAAIYGLPGVGELAHINAGSIPMCHGEQDQVEIAEARPEIVAEDREESPTVPELAHRDMAGYTPTDTDVFLFDVSDECGIDIADMSATETEFCAWAYKHAGDVETVAASLLEARAAAEVVKGAGDDPRGMSIPELLSVHAACFEESDDPVSAYRSLRLSA